MPREIRSGVSTPFWLTMPRPIRSTMANLNTFTGALARNSDKLDGIVAGLERLTGGGNNSRSTVVYDLTAPTQFPRDRQRTARPIDRRRADGADRVRDPEIPRPAEPKRRPDLRKAEWSDNVPKLLQAKIIQTFENAGLSQTVARPAEGVVADKQLAHRYSKIPDFHFARADGRNRVRRQDTVGQWPYRGSKSVPRERTGRGDECAVGRSGARPSVWHLRHRVGELGGRRHMKRLENRRSRK